MQLRRTLERCCVDGRGKASDSSAREVRRRVGFRAPEGDASIFWEGSPRCARSGWEGAAVAIDLAVALAAIAARTLVAELIRNKPLSQDSWAEVGAEVAGTLVSTAIRPSAGSLSQEYHVDRVGPRFDRVGQQLEHISEQVKQVGQKVDRVGERVNDLQARDFDRFMRAGSRYLRDLPVDWRTDQDRRELIRDARRSFVDAVAVAEQMQDAERQALAEVAIAGCWLWVPSIDDVRNTIGHARRILEREILFGQSLSTESYIDVLELCKAYGELPRTTKIPSLTEYKWRWVPEARASPSWRG
jgi:hypothetical protein